MGAKSGRNKRGRGAKKPAAPEKAAKVAAARKARSASASSSSAVVFIALFVVFAVAQGLGKPSVPSGDIALVTNVPSEIGHISEADYKNVARAAGNASPG